MDQIELITKNRLNLLVILFIYWCLQTIIEYSINIKVLKLCNKNANKEILKEFLCHKIVVKINNSYNQKKEKIEAEIKRGMSYKISLRYRHQRDYRTSFSQGATLLPKSVYIISTLSIESKYWQYSSRANRP